MSNPSLNVAIVGAGPAGMYAAEHLIKDGGYDVNIDVYDRLPTPWGLVRAGVAPDHPDKKLVADRLFKFVLANADVRFFGNVEVGKHISADELADWYDAVIYATGANSDVVMNIPGEDLPGCHAAREFVAWYNGHPDYSHLTFNFETERAVVVGNGNVAIDVARVLTLPIEELEKTDIADYALAALKNSKIQEVVILGRRGPAQAAFHNPELAELEYLDGVDVIVDTADLPAGSFDDSAANDWDTGRKLSTLRQFAAAPATAGNKRIKLAFLQSPTEITGDGQAQQLHVAINELIANEAGQLKATPTGESQTIEAGLVLRSIGYRGTAFPGLPYDEKASVIEHVAGRVGTNGQAMPGVYVTGWIKRGPKGVIGSNKKCARETVHNLLADAMLGRLPAANKSLDAIAALLSERQPNLVTHNGWQKIDEQELADGKRQNRLRNKITSVVKLTEVAQAAI